MPLETRPVDSVRGMLDLNARQAHAQAQLRQSLLDTFQLASYIPIDVPLVEQADLYLRKSGAEIISKMYTFEDFGGRRLALRPEFTASIVRYYLSNDQNAPFPLRYAYAGPVFRYEKPQRGRFRQFSMAGVELLGSDGPSADAEVIALACWTLKRLGIDRYRLVIGHVGILLELLGSLGLSTRLRHFLARQHGRRRQTGTRSIVRAQTAGRNTPHPTHRHSTHRRPAGLRGASTRFAAGFIAGDGHRVAR